MRNTIYKKVIKTSQFRSIVFLIEIFLLIVEFLKDALLIKKKNKLLFEKLLSENKKYQSIFKKYMITISNSLYWDIKRRYNLEHLDYSDHTEFITSDKSYNYCNLKSSNPHYILSNILTG